MNPLAWAQSFFGASIPVLCYHQVRPNSGMTPQKFGQHLDLLRSMGFETITLRRLYRIILKKVPIKKPVVVLTFDDCTLDNWIYAVPELSHRGMRGVFFAITDFLLPGVARPRADQTVNPVAVPDFPTIMRQALRGDCSGFMNQSEVRALIRDLGMEVYAHSAAHQACFISTRRTGLLRDDQHWSHRPLCGSSGTDSTPAYPVGSAYAHAGFGLDWHGLPLNLSAAEDREAFCLDDFSNSRQRLEDITGQPCPFLCLPWGEYDEITLQVAHATGYQGVLNLGAGFVGPGTDPLRVGRLVVKDRKRRAWLALKTILLAIKPLAGMVRGRRSGGRT